jgi:hypothetical protein
VIAITREHFGNQDKCPGPSGAANFLSGLPEESKHLVWDHLVLLNN